MVRPHSGAHVEGWSERFKARNSKFRPLLGNTGSNPVPSAKLDVYPFVVKVKNQRFAPVAQWIEYKIPDLAVGGSTPLRCA